MINQGNKDKLNQGHLDRLVGAIIGWISGFRGSWDQAVLESGTICGGGISCRVQWQVALGPS